MTREILFRGYCPEENRWVYGFYLDPRKPIDWENVFEQVDEMNGYVVTALSTLKVARTAMEFIQTKQFELEGPRKVAK